MSEPPREMSGTDPDLAGRRPLLAANWKMNFRAGEAARYFEAFLARLLDLHDRDALFFVPAVLIEEAVGAVVGTGVAIGAQNIHWEDKGAFTGEISGPMVASTGATHCLVGHSERRWLFGEDERVVRRKLEAALRSGLRPILCVGERIEERRAGRAEATVASQMRSATAGLGTAELARLAIAYEPVWAIGTGETATPEVAGAMHAAVRATLAETAGAEIARRTRVLYGGSVTRDNIDRLMAEPGIDGVLVGGASLDPDGFRRIVEFRDLTVPASRPTARGSA